MLDKLAHALFLGRVHARGRLVEDEKARLQREGTCNLEPSLVAVGQCACGTPADLCGVKANGLHEAVGFVEPGALVAAEQRQSAQLRERVVAAARVHADDHVLGCAQILEQADVLKSAGDPEPRDPIRG